MEGVNNSNGQKLTLPNEFIHDELSYRAYSLMTRFRMKYIMELVDLWLSSKSTLPPLELEDDDGDEDGEDKQEGHNQDPSYLSPKDLRMVKYLKEELASSKLTKLNFVQKLRFEYWHDGFNLQQVADVETRHIVRSKDKHSWTYSTLYIGNKQFVPVIDPTTFLKALQKSLYPLILGHIYVTQYKPLSLIIVRIQIFEPFSNGLQPLIPFYLAFPDSSPFVLHSAVASSGPGHGNSVHSILNMILYSLTKSLSGPGRTVSLKETDELPTKVLHSISIVKGTNFRKASSLGAWSIYANGIDESPLNPFIGTSKKNESKLGLKSKRIRLNDRDDEPTRIRKRRRLANILFTGEDNEKSEFKSDVSFPMIEIKLSEEFTGSFSVGDKEEKEEKEVNETANETAHESQNNPADEFIPNFTLRLEGEDVFAGIFKLAVDDTIDILRMPSWLTGEDGTTTIKVQQGRSVN